MSSQLIAPTDTGLESGSKLQRQLNPAAFARSSRDRGPRPSVPTTSAVNQHSRFGDVGAKNSAVSVILHCEGHKLGRAEAEGVGRAIKKVGRVIVSESV